MTGETTPVTGAPHIETDILEDGIGIALSGGGYRAMLFHTGAIIRLFETGLLQQAKRISSVSGGSIVAAKLGLEWHRLHDRAALLAHVVDPIRGMASTSIDIASVLVGTLLSGSVGARVAAAYERHLFGDATLQDLPDAPTFILNATNVETGSLFRFGKAYARDWRVGRIAHPKFRLADVVAASSAFPPVLSPFVLETIASDFDTVEPDVEPEFLNDIALTDGGVYDNLGLETVYKRYRTLLVSNGGGPVEPDAHPASDWVRHLRRIIDLIHSQVSSVRTRQLIDAFDSGARKGVYWGVATNIATYGLTDALPIAHAHSIALAQTPTRLARMDAALQERLINWGYAVCDAAIRSSSTTTAREAPPKFPYPPHADDNELTA